MLSATFAVWVHNLDPFLIRFSENMGVRYYGLAYVMAFVVGALLLIRYSKAGKSPLQAERVWDYIMALMIGVYVGGRVGHFLLYGGIERMREDPMSILRVWEGGMAFHGGLLGVGAAIWVFARMMKLGFRTLCDITTTVVPSGLFFGRIANFINGELWGKPTDASWAVIFPMSPPPMIPRHPSQLYEALLEGVILFVLVQWRFWRTDVVARHPGRLFGEFCIVYALMRSFCEIFREPDMSLILGLSRGTFYSIFMALLGLLFIWFSRRPEQGGATGNPERS